MINFRRFAQFIPKQSIEVKDNKWLVYFDLKPTRRFVYMYFASWSVIAGALVRLTKWFSDAERSTYQLPLYIAGGALAANFIREASSF